MAGQADELWADRDLLKAVNVNVSALSENQRQDSLDQVQETIERQGFDSQVYAGLGFPGKAKNLTLDGGLQTRRSRLKWIAL